MVAQHWMLDLYIWKPYIFDFFQQGGGVQIPCLRWRSSIVKNVFDCRLSGVGGYKQFGRCILVENLKHRWIKITDLISKSFSGKKITLFTNINEMTYSRWSWNYRRREGGGGWGQGPTDQKVLTFLYVFKSNLIYGVLPEIFFSKVTGGWVMHL